MRKAPPDGTRPDSPVPSISPLATKQYVSGDPPGFAKCLEYYGD